MKKKKQKGFDVGTKVRHISREVFHGKLPCEKTMRDRKKFHKGSRGKNKRAISFLKDGSLFCLSTCVWFRVLYVSSETLLTPFLLLRDCFK